MEFNEKTHSYETYSAEQGDFYRVFCPVQNSKLDLAKEPKFCPMCGKKFDEGDFK